MKKHFLATSAIVGSLFAFAGQASAQTTITADMHLTYSAISNKGSAGAADKAGSYRGFGKETQLNIRNVGKLSNGAGYAAGFSIEHDGNDRTSTTTTAGPECFCYTVDNQTAGTLEYTYTDCGSEVATTASINADTITYVCSSTAVTGDDGLIITGGTVSCNNAEGCV